MACNQTLAGITRDCAANAGGVKRVLIAIFDDVTAKTLDTSGAKINAITMASGKKFKEFYVRRAVSNAVSTPQYNDAGDYVGEQTILALAFQRQDTTKRTQVAALSVSDLAVIYEDNNGTFWYLGYDNPVRRSGGTAESGTALTDTNRYGVELQDDAFQLPYEVDAQIISSLVD